MNIEPLRHWIGTERPEPRVYIKVTDDRWNQLVNLLFRQLDAPSADFYDEVVWTFLLGLSYAAGGWDGIQKLEWLLSGRKVDPSVQHGIRLEALPIPPRTKEGNTNVDLAIGAIGDRFATEVNMTDLNSKEGGIAYDPAFGSSVTFCEMKWYSDIAYKVTHDQHRNQLSRVIENAVTFQSRGQRVDQVTVTLVTPGIFVATDTAPKSRLYQYKFEEYRRDPSILLAEWICSDKHMPKRYQDDWKYPEIDDLSDLLENRFALQHLSFEDLFAQAPESELSPFFKEFVSTFNGSEKRFGCVPSA